MHLVHPIWKDATLSKICHNRFSNSLFQRCVLDVVKTRIQIESKNTEEYSSIRNAFRTMVRNEGYGAFWKGLTARITWIAPACALTLAACKYIDCIIFILKILLINITR